MRKIQIETVVAGFEDEGSHVSDEPEMYHNLNQRAKMTKIFEQYIGENTYNLGYTKPS